MTQQKKSVYQAATATEKPSRHTLAILVDNTPGTLARIVGLFSGRGYNIESLAVAPTDATNTMSRITIVSHGTNAVIDQIRHQVERLIPVHTVSDLTEEGPAIEREMALLKVAGTGEKRIEALRIAEIFRARTVDSTLDSFVFETTGTAEKINALIDLMAPLGLIETCRTGIVGLCRGTGTLDKAKTDSLRTYHEKISDPSDADGGDGHADGMHVARTG